MYNSHPAFNEPENQNAKLTKYMAYKWFIPLIEKKYLYFPSIEKLRKGEPREAALAAASLNPPKSFGEKDMQTMRVFASQEGAKYVYVCPFYLSEDESLTMWKSHAKDKGVAIQTNFAKLRNAFDKNAQYVVGAGTIEYGNRQAENNMYDLIVHKDTDFDFEKEFRAVISGDTAQGAIEFPLDWNEVIEYIIISPFESEKFKQEVTQFVEKYGIPAKKVIPSHFHK